MSRALVYECGPLGNADQLPGAVESGPVSHSGSLAAAGVLGLRNLGAVALGTCFPSCALSASGSCFRLALGVQLIRDSAAEIARGIRENCAPGHLHGLF